MTGTPELFSEDDRRRIREAVQAAEKDTSGEIVVVVAEASDGYDAAPWRGALALSGLVMLGDVGYRHLASFWVQWNPDAAWLTALAAGGVGHLAAAWAPLRRVLAGRKAMSRGVRRGADAAFAAEGVFLTRERTGILIYLSLLERQVVVLPDTGIARKAPEAAWAGLVETIVRGIRAGRASDALVAAVQSCGDVLRAAGFVAGPEDTNEIPDDARFR
jgi:putative membrane protein